MKDRIEINGVWYIKEDNYNKEPKLEIHKSYVKYYEDDDIFLEAVFDDADFKELGFINYKNKVTEFSEIWDNDLWFNGILNNKPESLAELLTVNINSKNLIVQFIKQIHNE